MSFWQWKREDTKEGANGKRHVCPSYCVLTPGKQFLPRSIGELCPPPVS